MSVGFSDLYIEQGTTVNLQLSLEDYFDDMFDISNFTVQSQARTSYTAANATISFNASVYDGANGVIQLSLDAYTCSTIPSGRYFYDVILIDQGSGSITRILEGILYVSPQITQIG